MTRKYLPFAAAALTMLVGGRMAAAVATSIADLIFLIFCAIATALAVGTGAALICSESVEGNDTEAEK